jgi:hypothetical protein
MFDKTLSAVSFLDALYTTKVNASVSPASALSSADVASLYTASFHRGLTGSPWFGDIVRNQLAALDGTHALR